MLPKFSFEPSFSGKTDTIQRLAVKLLNKSYKRTKLRNEQDYLKVLEEYNSKIKYINFSGNMVDDLLAKNILDLKPKVEEVEEEKEVTLKKELIRVLLPG